MVDWQFWTLISTIYLAGGLAGSSNVGTLILLLASIVAGVIAGVMKLLGT